MRNEQDSKVRRPRWRRKRNVTVLLAVLFALSVTISACGSSNDSGASNKVTFALGFSPNYGQESFFNALQAGYYKDAGLDVNYVVPDSTQTAAKLVGIGRADAGEWFGLDPIIAAGQGIPVKVAATTAWIQIGLMANPGSDVKSVKDVKGKTVGTFAGLPYSAACRPRLLEANGLTEDDVNTVDIGFNAVTPLLAGKVDAVEGGKPAETVTYQLETGKPPTFFSYNEVCPPTLVGVFVNTDWAEQNPDTAQKFIEATLKGAKLGIENPNESHKLFTDRFPDLKQELLQFVKWGKAACGPDSAQQGLGYLPRQTYEDLIQLSKDQNLVPNDLSYDKVVTDKYLPDTPVKSPGCK